MKIAGAATGDVSQSDSKVLLSEQTAQEIALEISTSSNKFFEPQEQIKQKNNGNGAKFAAPEKAICETTLENDLLLNKIFELQEKLENLETNNNSSSTESRTIAHDKILVKEFEAENELLTTQLLNTQEILEATLSNKELLKEKHRLQTVRLQKLTAKLSSFWEAESFETKDTSGTETAKTIEWRFRNLYLGERFFPQLNFTTELIETHVNLRIERSVRGSNHPCPLLRWPESFALDDTLPCMPIAGTSNQGTNAAISELGASDWVFLLDLVKKLMDFAQNPSESAPEIIKHSFFLSGLKKLYNTLKSWPLQLRYDHVSIKEIDGRANYTGLNFNLTGLSFGEKHWPSLNYILSTVDDLSMTFGTNPRLEFPATSSKNVLSSWYAEQKDENGERFELRFAQPNIMDMRVWNSLESPDQLLITALISRMPRMLSQHKNKKTSDENPLIDWIVLAESLRTNLAYNTIPRMRRNKKTA
ncbi:hypothetical protein [Pseudomonas umsongensis]|uniref:Uncharacterized protein n=1 Tax=Pseudomonas umsongensis TaxID=198618 RepID=A0AAE7DDF5_9PSED|nr:hypothetical protein [Pseudomonas umsongensis]QJC78449.1 hypothetical protein HGP31_09030 [Pseudomonas umsongensis]